MFYEKRISYVFLMLLIVIVSLVACGKENSQESAEYVMESQIIEGILEPDAGKLIYSMPQEVQEVLWDLAATEEGLFTQEAVIDS